MSNVTSSPRGTLLVGYILPPRKEAQRDQNSDSEEEEEEEDEPEFLDMGEMESLSAGGRIFQSSVPPRLEVNFQTSDSRKTLRLEGRFPLTDPWWEVSCWVGRLRNGRAVLQGFPSYTLRRDLRGEDSRSMVSLFLTACGVAPSYVTEFMGWLPAGAEVGLSTLPELLEQFEGVEQHKTVADHMKRLVSKSVAGGCLHVSTRYPLVLRYLPTLLPRQFKELLGMGKKKDKDSPQEQTEVKLSEDLLAGLEKIIRTEVWKLGFNHIVYRDLHLIRCEARLEAFVACGLFQKIPDLQQHALRVYDQLKCQCQRLGSTYVERRDLEEQMGPALSELSVWDAVHFLKDEGVLVLERQKVALRNLYTYETGIGKQLALLAREEAKPWHIDLDVRRVLTEAQEERLKARAEAEAEAHAEAGENTPGGQVSGSGAPKQETEAVTVTETSKEQVGVTGNGPSEDPGYSNVEPTSTQAVHTNGSSSWDVTFDLTFLTPSQEAPGPEEPAQDLPVELELDPDQVRAAEMICANPVTVISGKGGCGKTTVVSLVFKAAMQQCHRDMEEVQKACQDFQNDSGGSQPMPESDPQANEEDKEKEEEEEDEKVEVLLTAPTGRAAGLLTKRTGFTAYTMHQVLVSYMNWKKVKDKASAEGPREGSRWKFRRVRVLVVDEGSLVSVQILHSLLAILTREARLQKFILLGDVRQLPSIEPGNALYDLFHSLQKVHWSIEMRTNHRAESELIVKNAGLIADMGQKRCYGPLDFDAIVDMDYSPEVPADNRRFIYVRVSENDCALQDAVLLLLRNGVGLQDHRNSQFIAFRRKDCALINELCCHHYVKHATKNHRNRMDFRVGDKICCTRNSYVCDRSHELGQTGAAQTEQQAAVAVPTHQAAALHSSDPQEGTGNGRTEHTRRKARKMKEEEEKEPVKERLCNGEIFYITEDRTVVEEDSRSKRKRRYIMLDDGQGRVLCVLFRELQRLCRIQHAWARTIHTFQGSEAETIVYVVGSGAAQDWRHVYTAVTRGQKRVYVVSKDADIEMAIRRPVRKRSTRLGQLVRELVLKQQSGEEDPMNQSQLTQLCLGTPKRGPGFWPFQASQTPSQTPGPSTVHRDTNEECTGQDMDRSDICLQDDLNFSQVYNWSPMESAEDPTASQCKQPTTDSAQGAVARDTDLPGDIRGPQSPVGNKRAADFKKWSTPPKLLRVASADSPTGATSGLGLLTLNSPSPAPVVKHLFPRTAGEDAATTSPVVRFRPRVGLSKWFGAASRCKQEEDEDEEEGGAGPSSGHLKREFPFRKVPGSDRPQDPSLEKSNATVLPVIKCQNISRGPCKETSKEICLQDDIAFTQTYSWSPMGCGDDPSEMHHGSSVADGMEFGFPKEIDVLQATPN